MNLTTNEDKRTTNLVWKFLHTLLKVSMSAKIFIPRDLTSHKSGKLHPLNQAMTQTSLKRLRNYQIDELASLFFKVTLAIEMY